MVSGSIVPAIANWLKERLRDAAMWPVNLIRDFPVRFGRLSRTLGRGVAGIVRFLPGAVRAWRRGEMALWLWQSAGGVTGWLHQFLAQSFDLLGGPEVAQFFMHLPTKTTPLSSDEIAVISSILGTRGLRYGDVRVAEGGLFDLVFKYNGNLAFATWHTINMPRTGGHTRATLAIVVHELTHVYQYERVGSRYLGEAIYMLIKTKRNCYDYGSADGLRAATAAGKVFGDYNREQQAMIVQDYFTLREKGGDVAAYKPFVAHLRAGRL
ncbi:MAG TPA: hypothetical protein VF177_23060 [Anaerolineae bacterium]